MARPRLIALAVGACFTAQGAFANPTGPTVVHGSATFQQSANLLQVNNAANTIINWQSFSIGAAEVTRFVQPSAASAVLNRVTTGSPSAILGALQSNGRVFLVNPAGIVFGAGSQIDVAGLVASTLAMSNDDFLAGRMRFATMGAAGAIDQQGTINTPSGGQVYLVGADVTNGGLIRSPQGEVVLAAGESVELVNPATPGLRVEVSAGEHAARNLGTIVADAGRIGIYAGLATQSGTLRADSAVAEGGRIMLKAARSASIAAGSHTSAKGGGGVVDIRSTDAALIAGRVEADTLVSIVVSDGALRVDGNVGAHGGGSATVLLSAPAGTVTGKGILAASRSDGIPATIRIRARDGVGASGSPIRIADNKARLFVENTDSGPVVIALVSGNLHITENAADVVNRAPNGVVEGVAENGNALVTAAVDKRGNRLIVRSLTGDVIVSAPLAAVAVDLIAHRDVIVTSKIEGALSATATTGSVKLPAAGGVEASPPAAGELGRRAGVDGALNQVIDAARFMLLLPQRRPGGGALASRDEEDEKEEAVRHAKQ